jgi:cell division protein FtsW (lipid II flippase)
LASKYFENDLLQCARQLFGSIHVPDAYRARIEQAANLVMTGQFTDNDVNKLKTDLTRIYTDQILIDRGLFRKVTHSLLYSIVLVLIYQLVVNFVYGMIGDSRQHRIIAEGAFNAVDLGILAGLTTIYFDDEFWWSGIIFFAYFVHLVYLGAILSNPLFHDRRMIATITAYISAVLMPILIAAVALDSWKYPAFGVGIILMCMLLAFLVISLAPNQVNRLVPLADLLRDLQKNGAQRIEDVRASGKPEDTRQEEAPAPAPRAEGAGAGSQRHIP